MAFSNLEKKAFKDGFKIIAGADEAGRGCLAGPVSSAVVIAKSCKSFSFVEQIKDSKQLSVKKRQEMFEKIKKEKNIEWKVNFIWPEMIDKINILEATKLAWKNCLKELKYQPNLLLIDGNQEISGLKMKQKAIINGDQEILLISLASIVAKVSRDKLMEDLSLKYPEYIFNQHKGYGTKLHLEKIKEFGPCEIHRKSFKPICKL